MEDVLRAGVVTVNRSLSSMVGGGSTAEERVRPRRSRRLRNMRLSSLTVGHRSTVMRYVPCRDSTTFVSEFPESAVETSLALRSFMMDSLSCPRQA